MSRFRNRFYFGAIFVTNLLNRSILGFVRRTISFNTSLILCSIRLEFKFKKQPFRVFRGPCEISSFFVNKLSFSVVLY